MLTVNRLIAVVCDSFSALTLLIGRWEGWLDALLSVVGSGDLNGAFHLF